MPDFSMQNNYESAFLDNKHVSITIQNLGDAKKKKKKKNSSSRIEPVQRIVCIELNTS